MNPETSCLRQSVVGNTHETIAWFHGSFALLFSPLFSRHASNPERSHENGLSNGTVSNRDLLSDGDFLSEISLALAARIWTGPPVRIYPLRAGRKDRGTTTDGT